MRTLLIVTCLLFVMLGTGCAASLHLEQMLELAQKQNLLLQRAAHNPKIAAAALRQATSFGLPQLELNGSYRLQNDAQQVIIGTLHEPTQDSQFAQLSLSATQIVYDFGRNAGRVAQAREQLAATNYSYQQLKQEVLLQTLAAYFQVLRTEQNLTAANEEVASLEEHRRVAQTLYETGVVTRNDLLQAKVQLAASRQAQTVQDNQLANSWANLNYLTGRELTTRDQLSDVPLPASYSKPNSNLSGRPDLIAQQHLVEKAHRALEQSRSEFWPQIYARASIDYLENSHVTEQTIGTASIGFKANLFDGFATSSRLQQALQHWSQERERLHELKVQAQLEYHTADNDAQSAWARIKTTEQTIHQAEENLRINRERYADQVGTASEVLDAETLLTRSRNQFYQARYEYQTALARVAKAAGQDIYSGEKHE